MVGARKVAAGFEDLGITYVAAEQPLPKTELLQRLNRVCELGIRLTVIVLRGRHPPKPDVSLGYVRGL
jgi:hypothetical protein